MRPGEASPIEEATGGDPATGPDGQSAEGAVDPLIGATIAGKFQIEALLGAGAMGRVFRARQLTLDKPVAIKVLNAALAADPTFVARFAREAKAAARLDHPNSIRVFDFGREPDGLFYIAMELVAGNDLATEIELRGPMRADQIADILGQVLAALSVAHEMGVLHRDLKPANVLILRRKDDEGRPVDVAKVCDFGIAKIVGTSSEAGAERAGTHPLTAGLVVGTPEYMAPEQARGAEVDARADLYAVGIMLFQMLTGRVPFACDTPLGTVIKHVTERPARPSAIRADVDPTLEAICLRALEKNPADRFQTASEMRLALLEAARRPSASLPKVDPAADTPRAFEPVATASSVDPIEPTRDDTRHPTLGGVTPGQQARRAPQTARIARWVGLAAGATLLGAAIVVAAARLRHDRTEIRPPAPPPSADESSTTAKLAPAAPSATASVATAAAPPSAEEPVAVKAVAPAVPASPATKPTRAKTAPAAELSAKPAATAESAPVSALPETAAASMQAPVASPPPAPSEPPPPVAPLPVAAPAPPRWDVTLARVLVQPAARASGATVGSVNRAIASAAAPLTACYRAVLPQLSGPVDGEATLHIETDGAGTITDARFAGALGQSIQSCAASAIIGRRIANVDTGSASADIPLVFRPR